MHYESIQFILEFIGTIAFAISGALLGVRRSMDIFGTMVLGLVTAVGGGMIRDLTLGITPPAAFTDSIWTLIAVVVSLLVFLSFYRRGNHLNSRFLITFEKYLVFFDALGLAAFTIVGMNTAAGIGYVNQHFLILFCGMATGIGGGIIRDLQAVLITSLGLFFGAYLIDLIDRYAPHEHLIDKKVEGKNTDSLKEIWLFIIAITIHNFPEGLATGVGFGTDSLKNGITIALGIGLQNMPEGLAVALALVRERYSTKKAFLIALFTGLVEPVGAFLGIFLVQVFQPILPFILALAGGAMLFVISDEIIPETHSNGYERQATYGIIIGFIVMMVLDVTLG